MPEKNSSPSMVNSSYRSIFKATSLFGGVQVYQILIGIVRSKFIALLLGPAGMGIQGLYQSTIDLIKSVSSVGLDQSAVRDISEANGRGDDLHIAQTIATVRRLIWFTGTIGLVITLAFSPFLSRITFGNDDYTWGFSILSVTLLINQLCAGQKVLLQGMRRLRDLAKASALGSTIGLLVSIPLYYLFGQKGIVPTMVLSSVAALLLSWFYSKRIKVNSVSITTSQAFANGRSMLKMGVALSVSGILTTLFGYILRWFIRQHGGIDEVGLFTAGSLIMNTYVGMVFSAMATDYYPRLSAVNNDNSKCGEIINQQGEVAVLVLAPIILSCIILMPFLIRLIYSDSFLPAKDYILIAVIGTMFKAASWVISFSFIAKAESRLFIINEAVASFYSLILNLLGYYFGGLAGLGWSYIVSYLLYLIQVYVIANRRYGFRFSISFRKVYSIQTILVIVCFMILLTIEHSSVKYILSFIIFICSTYYSIKELDSRMGLISMLKNRVHHE